MSLKLSPRSEELRAAHLQAAEADHAVHHLGDTETVAEVVEGVVLVVVMDTKLHRTGKRDKRAETFDHMNPQKNLTKRARHEHCCSVPGSGPGLTSHLLSVMGLMLKSLTKPRSWYICSRQLSI